MEKLYEYLSPYEAPLDSKAIYEEIKRRLKVEPLVTQCDNAAHSVKVVLPEELSKPEKKELDKLMEEVFKKSKEGGGGVGAK